MPYYKSDTDQIEDYVQVVDCLQSFMNEYGNHVPVKILGDFNAKLPSCVKTSSSGIYKYNGFTEFSHVLHDFILSNDMCVCDFSFNQSTNYTYFCDARGVRTWIDHILSTNHHAEDVIGCYIHVRDEQLVSDHLPS